MARKYKTLGTKKRKYTFVTTMNQSYYDLCGKRMIDTFLEYADPNFELCVIAEDVASRFDNRIKVYDWNYICKLDWQNFCSKTNNNKEQKFAKKGFAFLYSLKNIGTHRLIWLDSDIIFHNNFDSSIIENTIKNKMIGLFDHKYLGDKGYSAESGYVILDKKHIEYQNFVDKYEMYYIIETKPEQIQRWYDGQVCMLAASHFEKYVFDLSTYKYEHVDTHTPLNHCPLNYYFTHNKGPEKKKWYNNK